MNHTINSIRPFIGAKDFQVSRSFYTDFGFEEVVLGDNFSYFKMGAFGFYLQGAYVKDWIDNTMVFLEVEDVDTYFKHLISLELPKKYVGTKLVPPVTLPWGKEGFVHDPSNILWHIGQFNV